jgi:hypothetical protein
VFEVSLSYQLWDRLFILHYVNLRTWTLPIWIYSWDRHWRAQYQLCGSSSLRQQHRACSFRS